MSTGSGREISESGNVFVDEGIKEILGEPAETPHESEHLNNIHNQALQLEQEEGVAYIHPDLMELDDTGFDSIVLDHNVVLDIARRSERVVYNDVSYDWTVPLHMMEIALKNNMVLYSPEDMHEKLVEQIDWNASRQIESGLEAVSCPLDMDYEKSFSRTHPGMEEDAKIARNSSQLEGNPVIATYDSDFIDLTEDYQIMAAAPERLDYLLREMHA